MRRLRIFCVGAFLLAGSLLVQAQPQPPVTPSGGGAYRIGGGVSAPSVLSKVEPHYSKEATKAGLQGTVALSLVVSDEGRPQDLKVLRSLGLGLDEKAIEAVEQWRFKPAMKDGKPVPVKATIEVNFRLVPEYQLAEEKRAAEEKAERLERVRLANVATEQARQAQIAKAQAIGVDLAKVKFLVTGCEELRGVVGVVRREIDLSNDEAARLILNSGAIYASGQCPHPLAMNTFQTKGGFANIVVTLRRGDPTTFTEERFNYKATGSSISQKITNAYPEEAVWGRNYDETQLTWGEYQNIEKQRVDRERNEVAQREAETAQRRAQQQAQEAQAKAFALKTETFFKKAGSRQTVRLGDFCQNPFPYVGKVVTFPLSGFWTWKATSATSAYLDIGCSVSMSGVPSSVLTPAFNGPKVIALKILGNSNGILLVQYIYHEPCAVTGIFNMCSDFPGIAY